MAAGDTAVVNVSEPQVVQADAASLKGYMTIAVTVLNSLVGILPADNVARKVLEKVVVVLNADWFVSILVFLVNSFSHKGAVGPDELSAALQQYSGAVTQGPPPTVVT